MEVLVNKRIPGKEYHSGTIFCEDCGEEVKRRGNSHLRCSDCASEHVLHTRQKKIERYFPVIRDDSRWLADYWLTAGNYNEKQITRADERHAKYREFDIPSPCDDCRLKRECIPRLLACRSFWEWTLKSTKRRSSWGRRTNPSRKYY